MNRSASSVTASIGGSGIVATELGKSLASRGHHVHVLSSDTPFRLGDYQPGLSFHRVGTPNYPLFREPQYLLALANKIVQVSRDERLDIIHAHYAVPHRDYAGYSGAPDSRRDQWPEDAAEGHHDAARHGHPHWASARTARSAGDRRFRSRDPDGVTAVSESLKQDTYRELGESRDIRVIPNFVDGDITRRSDRSELHQLPRPP